MCAASLDFRFAALFLWMMLRFANLSSIFCTFGNKATASALSVVVRSFFTALRTRRHDAPHCRFIICFVHGSAYHNGSTSTHKNRSPRKQGRHHHAIGKRPESASAGKARLPPSTHPKLGVSSRHQRFHRCALQRIFSPSFGDG